MDPTTPPQQAPRGRLTASAVLDLTDPRLPGLACALDKAISEVSRGQRVVIRLGAHSPYDLDSRIPGVLSGALLQGVDVHLEGPADVIDQWRRVVELPPPPPLKPLEQRRRLRVVRS